jgi:mRNA interferase YafQ
MRSVLITNHYKRDVLRLHKKHYDVQLLTDITKVLQQDGVAPAPYEPHKLHGKWNGYFECHIAHDWLLIYKIDAKFVYLYRTGSHNDLF